MFTIRSNTADVIQVTVQMAVKMFITSFKCQLTGDSIDDRQKGGYQWKDYQQGKGAL